MKKYRSFGKEFKESLIAQIDSGAITKSAAGREHNISVSLIDRWQKQMHEGTLRSIPTAREKQLERELDRYKKKVGELAVQVDLLKKLNETSALSRKSNGYVVTGRNADQSKQSAK